MPTCINTVLATIPEISASSRCYEGATSMCIYCGTASYRKIYESHFGPIPKDIHGRTFDIHHKDGNRKNNSIDNLEALCIEDHYKRHYDQGDYSACLRISQRMKLGSLEQSQLAQKAQQLRVKNGTHHLLKQNRSVESIKKMQHQIQKLVENGLHHWTTPEHSKRTQQIQSQKVANGTHHLLGGEINRRRVANGTHPFLGGEMQRAAQLKRVADGSASAHMIKINKERMENGTHQNLQIHTCPHCEKSGTGPSFKLAHFDNCVTIVGKTVVTCPHCQTVGSARGPIMKRWHFDNCIHKYPDKQWTHTQETKDTMSKTRKGKSTGWRLSPESRESQKKAVSLALKDKPKIQVTCPHCQKTGGKPAMTRFHFENCKEIK